MLEWIALYMLIVLTLAGQLRPAAVTQQETTVDRTRTVLHPLIVVSPNNAYDSYITPSWLGPFNLATRYINYYHNNNYDNLNYHRRHLYRRHSHYNHHNHHSRRPFDVFQPAGVLF